MLNREHRFKQVCIPVGCVPAALWPYWGGGVPGPGGVPVPGGYLVPEGVPVRGDTWSQGGYLVWGVPGPRGEYQVRGGTWSQGVGVPGPGGGVPGAGGGTWCRGEYLVSGGEYLVWGYLVWGGVPGLGGVPGPEGGVPGPGGSTWSGGYLVWGGVPGPGGYLPRYSPPLTESQTPVKTLPWPNFVAADNETSLK